MLFRSDMCCIKNNHKFQMRFGNFKNNNQRCGECFKQYNRGENHPSWKKDRTRKHRLDCLRYEYKSNAKIFRNDKSYNEWITTTNKYHVDHIFPRVAFIDHDIDKKYGLEMTKKICNDIENLQLLPKHENLSKGKKYNDLEFLFYIQRKIIEFKIKT